MTESALTEHVREQLDALDARSTFYSRHLETRAEVAIRADDPSLPTSVELTVFDALGRTVRRLVHDRRGTGSHEVQWDGRDDLGRPVGCGMYAYRLRTPTFMLDTTDVAPQVSCHRPRQRAARSTPPCDDADFNLSRVQDGGMHTLRFLTRHFPDTEPKR